MYERGPIYKGVGQGHGGEVVTDSPTSGQADHPTLSGGVEKQVRSAPLPRLLSNADPAGIILYFDVEPDSGFPESAERAPGRQPASLDISETTIHARVPAFGIRPSR
jgi:hypothetical protein